MTSPTTQQDYAIAIAHSDEDIAACFACMKELRPHLREDRFVARVRAMQPEKFQLAYIRDGDAVVAVAGYRYMHTLFGGDTLYVDDLITLPDERSRGYGGALIGWLRQQALEHGCDMLHLDSGTQRGRAHRFYFANGLHINSYHFAELLHDR